MALQLLNNSIEDQLRVEGINSKGMGQLAKFVMCSSDLDVKAKLIYSCIVSHCGAGHSSFPGRDLIVKEIGLNRQTYDKYMKSLKDTGLIKVTKAASKNGTYTNNIYTIAFMPDLLKGNKGFEKEGIYADGWGLIPNLLFRDERLSWKAKILYAYLTVFSDHMEHKCNPSPSQISGQLGVNKNWANGVFDELEKTGYIEKVQLIVKGRFSGNEYRLIQKPEVSDVTLPYPNFSTMDNSTTDKPSMDITSMQKPSVIISSTNKRIFNNTNINNINPINPSSKEPAGETEGQIESLSYEEILKYRKEKGTLPYNNIINDDQTRYGFVNGLFKECRRCLTYGDDIVYRTMKTCLEELLEEGSKFQSNGITIKPSKVLHYIDLLMDAEADFYGVFSGAKTDYENALKNGMIRSSHIEGYLKACLFSRLKSGEMRGEANFLRDFGEYSDRRTSAGRKFDEEYEKFFSDHPEFLERHQGLKKD